MKPFLRDVQQVTCIGQSGKIRIMKRKRYKKKPFKPVDNEQFKELRTVHRLSLKDVSGLLQVTVRTIANWESGGSRIPYTAFKLLRCLLGNELPQVEWLGWYIRGDTLYSPYQRSYKVHELIYISHVFTMARYWQQDRAERTRFRESVIASARSPLAFSSALPGESQIA